jgi:ABC-type phosphate transport system permease subunit
MRTSSAVRQFAAYPTHTTLLIVGVLLLASVVPLCAEPAATQPVNWFAAVCAAASAPRSGFLLPTLAVPARATAPRLMVTESAVRGAAPVRVFPAVGQDQTPPKHQRSWFGRHWGWFVAVPAIVFGAYGLTYLISCGTEGCD